MAKLKEIAEWLGAELDARDAEVEITSVASFARATAGSLVFAENAEALAAAMVSAAGAVVGPLGSESGSKPILRVKHPKLAFARAASRLNPQRAPAGVHPTAVIAPGVEIGAGTSVGPYVVIGINVSIGENCQIMPHVTIYPNTTLGNNVTVHAGAVLGSTGFGYVRDAETGEYVIFPQQGTLVIEENVEIGANTTIDRGALEETRIGAGSKLDNLVHIGHNCRIGRNVVIAAQTGISGSSVVEDGAVLGGQVGIGEHATVGTGVILGGGAGVLSGKKVRGPGQVFWGRPARPLKDYLKDLAALTRLRKHD